jgi:HEAT repeat protein
MSQFFDFSLQPASFVLGFVVATVFWWLLGKARPLWNDIRQNLAEQRESTQLRRTSSLEENHRRITLRRAQGMHLAAPLFALDEILQEPRVLAPLPTVEPGGPTAKDDVVTQTVPYLPAWPDLAAIYNAPTFTIPQALSRGSNIVIIGQPGIGKTVALAHIASITANRNEQLGDLQDYVPFLLHVADLKLPITDAKNVLNPMVDKASEFAPVFDLARLPGFIQASFRLGHALVLLDGYDELTADGQNTVVEYLKLLTQTYPKVRIVTTGAPEYIGGLINLGFAPLALAAWHPAQNEKFIRLWGELWTQYVAVEAWAQTGPEQVDPILLNTWLSTDNLNLNPMELTLKVWGAYAGDSLGSHVLEAIATHIRRIAPVGTPLAALEMLAMQIVLTAQPVFDPRKARKWVQSFEAPEDKPENISEKTQPTEKTEDGKSKKGKKGQKAAPAPSAGLLGKMAASGLLITHPGNRMRFAHPIFEGYLAGRALGSYDKESALLSQPDWSGKYLAIHYLAAHGDITKVVQSMLEWSRLPMHRPLLAASRWLRDAPRNAAWRGKLMGTLANLLQTEGLPLALRGQALAAFTTSNDPGASALFRQLMTSLSFDLVQLAALGSGATRDPKAIPLLKSAVQAPNLSTRKAACLALVAIGTTEALETVADILLNEDEDLRRAAAEALANDTKEGYAMLKDGATMQDILVRRSVVYGLARIPEPWAQEILSKLQLEDDQWVVRNAATEVIEANSAEDNPRIPHPLKAPSESPWLIEFAGKQGMGISPGTPATDILLLALKGDEPEVRLSALPYLRNTPTDGVITQLYNAMYRDDTKLREAAYQILWELGTAGIKLPNPTQFGLS